MAERQLSLSPGILLAYFLSTQLASAHQQSTDDLKKEIEALKESLKTIQKQMNTVSLKIAATSTPLSGPGVPRATEPKSYAKGIELLNHGLSWLMMGSAEVHPVRLTH